jgi:large subunit ribosomal protein L29
MSTNKAAEKINAMDPGERANQLQAGAESMFRLRFQMSMGQSDGVKKYRVLRKERARILTVQKERGDAPVAAVKAPVKAAKTAKTAKTAKKK